MTAKTRHNKIRGEYNFTPLCREILERVSADPHFIRKGAGNMTQAAEFLILSNPQVRRLKREIERRQKDARR